MGGGGGKEKGEGFCFTYYGVGLFGNKISVSVGSNQRGEEVSHHLERGREKRCVLL